MDVIYRILVLVHGLAGGAALLSFWSAALTRKGAGVHRAGGKLFVWTMLAVCVSALPMAAVYLTRDTVFGVFLTYLVVITGTSVWLGHRAVHWRASQAEFRGGAYVVVAGANLVAGAATMATGVVIGNLLLGGFSLVGIAQGSGMLFRQQRPLGGRNWKIQEHMGAMIGGGAATHVAFFALGLRRVAEHAGIQLPQIVTLLGWTLPVLVAVAAGAWLNRRYA